MGTFGIVYSEAWTDPDVVDNYTPEDKYFNLYLLTNPHINISGCYQISVKQTADEMGYSIESIEKLIERHEKAHKTVRYCKETKEILVVNWYKHHWTKSPKYTQALKKQINNIKNKEFKEYLTILYKAFEESSDIDTVSIPYPYPMDTSISISNTNTISNTNKKPTLEEVKKYVKEKNLNVDPNYFLDFFEERKWIDTKGKPVLDWKGKIRTWNSFAKAKQNAKVEAIPVYDASKNAEFDSNLFNQIMEKRQNDKDCV